MKKTISAFLSITLALAIFAGCSPTVADENSPPNLPEVQSPNPAAETQTYTDSTGRELVLPYNIEKIAVSGSLAQIFAFALAPDMLVGIATDWDDYSKKYVPEKYLSLPDLGQLYGGKGDLNLESLLMAEPDVVIDVGESKGSIAEDFDKLTKQSGIPFIHISADISSYGDAYLELGKLLGLEERARVLADYCNEVYNRTINIASSAQKVNMLYVVGEKGLNVIAKGSYHSEMIDLLCNNLAVVDEPISRGTGNEVDMEQILAWDPDYIIFEAGSIYASVASDRTWQSLSAIANGNYCEAPSGPYNWMGFPPSVQRYLGLIWMAKLFYPEVAEYDLYEEVQTYFELFYHTDLSVEQYDELVKNSLR